MRPDQLREHAFSKALFYAVRPVMEAEDDYHQHHDPADEYVPDEYEFYLLRVGNRLAGLLSHCEGLAHAILFMSNFRQTQSMTNAGISRTKHLRYSMETYIIRTQTLFDLVLKLVDAVFHLTNADSQCRYNTIVKNLKVIRTQVPHALRPLHKKIAEFEQARHTIVHRGGYQDGRLYRIELLTEIEDIYRRKGEELPAELQHVPGARAEMTREAIRRKKDDYRRFNSRIFQLVSEVLDALLDPFEDEKRRLHFLSNRIS